MLKHLPQLFSLENYYLNDLSVAPLIVASLAMIFGYFVYQLDRFSGFNRAFMYFCLTVTLWLSASGLYHNSLSAHNAEIWSDLIYVGLVLTPATLFHISIALTQRYARQKYILISMYALSSCFLVSTWTLYFLNYYLIIFVLLFFVASFFNILHYHHIVESSAERIKVRFFIFAYMLLALSYVYILQIRDISIDPLGYFPVLCFVLSVTLSTIRWQFDSIRQKSEQQENEIVEKALEISKMVNELKATQIRLLEVGKVSSLASLSAGIMHQISQPITAIHGFLKFIKKEMNPNDTFYRPICLMEEQSVYLKEMLEDLMELIRHRTITKENINVNEPLNRALSLLTDELRIRRVNWDLELTDKLPPVYADSIHLQQVFMNIVVNAIQAMGTLPRGAMRYLKVTSDFNANDNKIVLTFKDTGPGLAAEDMNQVFEPFFSTKTTGAGLGLALCKDLITEHRGTVEVDSTPGQGAKFIIKFPPSEQPDLEK